MRLLYNFYDWRSLVLLLGTEIRNPTNIVTRVNLNLLDSLDIDITGLVLQIFDFCGSQGCSLPELLHENELTASRSR